MELLEYQAKELFRGVGIPVLPSQRIDNPRDIRRLQLDYPIVLKSQVRVGGRGKAGGIRFVENTIDAIAAARTILNLAIAGEYPQVLLAEARYDAQREFFLAVVLDYQLKRPVLLGSIQGGIDVDAVVEKMTKVAIEDEFSPFYARRLASRMGLQGELLQSVSEIIQKMYDLFVFKDLDLVEINPLGVSKDGELMALDGKITVNDYSLGRHPDLISLADSEQISALTSEKILFQPAQSLPLSLKSKWVNKAGNVGIISNSVGLALATWDLLCQDGSVPNCCAIVDDGEIATQLELAIAQLSEDIEELQVVLVNILSDSVTATKVGEAIADYLLPDFNETRASRSEDRLERPTAVVSRSRRENREPQIKPQPENQPPQFVIRVVGGELDSIRERLTAMPVHWTDSLEEAVNLTVSLSNPETTD
ncbi:ATP-grasp domain-containing protein [Oscillatoria salina]|uniref:ATP-grasp domain-containing protein n=1 Tax=Oscillatoria salina TaxID=331517 RepID=UPI0013BB00AA|nr:ATP-grasp domain-containing protein [Oscillatoria salina]MBZ8183010.1 succinate--CoA ligase subunit beta [Oscillatoria salina IIICB1]NET86629.1 succinate--CoA ligase subunit beta [Kamptonema sp. SIO1D9]